MGASWVPPSVRSSTGHSVCLTTLKCTNATNPLLLKLSYPKLSHPIHLYLTFEKSSQKQLSKIKLDELDFWSISNQIFAGYTGSKNQVRNRLNIKFVQLDFWKKFQTRYFKNQVQKSSTDGQGVEIINLNLIVVTSKQK